MLGHKLPGADVLLPALLSPQITSAVTEGLRVSLLGARSLFMQARLRDR